MKLDNPSRFFILVVDDNEMNRDLIGRRLIQEGYQVVMAENGKQALEIVKARSIDLVLLDIMMPEMNGYQVLEIMKSDPILRSIPVIMISAVGEIESVIRCIDLGAEDYLPKPFNPTLLKARVSSSLEKKSFHDQEQNYLKMIEEEKEKSEKLLLNILPKAIATELKTGKVLIANSFPEVTVLFADLVGFTKLSAQYSPETIVSLLNELFSAFDELAELFGVEKIKTIGDDYMAASGLPIPRPDHAEAMAQLALAMQKEIEALNKRRNTAFTIRIGINSGPVIAGVIGKNKFCYDLWGDTVNIASRMESHGIAGAIQVTERTYTLLKDKYRFEKRGTVEVRSAGPRETYLLLGTQNA